MGAARQLFPIQRGRLIMPGKSARKPRILLLNGCNLNMLGVREPEIYGSQTLKEIERRLKEKAKAAGVGLETFQSNSEGELIGRIQEALGRADVILINPGAFTHTSVGIHDAIKAVNIPAIELHLSNIHARESFRHASLIAPACAGQVAGFGPASYDIAFDAALRLLEEKP
jgi:3-dehydroquinate dehydratase-2